MNGNNLRKHGRKGPKAKTGCRTCKIRRIKCDEGRPACQRCVTTGRTCDGYGILDNSSNRPCSGPVRSLVSAPCNTVSDHDRAGFQWFSARTRYKMPGTFASGFWESVVLQASWREPAVLQAVLALSAAHKRHVLDASGPDSRQGLPDGQERVLLRHYSSAIKLLQPHLSVKSKENLRVALISCIVFTCLEFLRQHYKTGHVLLQHGLKLLNSIQPQFHGDLGDAILLKHQPESINDTLIEEMARLDVQAALLGYGSRQVCVIVPSPSFNDDPKVFRSVRMARQRLDTLLDAIHRLQHQSLATECVASQLRIRTGLSSWLVTYKATLSNPEKQLDPREVIAYRLLLIYHNMTIIMVATCLPFTEESMFDLYTPEFTTLISQCTDLISFASPEAVSNAFAGVCKARPAFIADMGNNIPDGRDDANARPYGFWHPDFASPKTYRELPRQYPAMRYHVGRACAAAGYTALYAELGLLPDISIAKEARESKRNSRAIFDSIMRNPVKYEIMDDYTRTVNTQNPEAPAYLNGDTCVYAHLEDRNESYAYP
ncbi:hypothetical protein QQX98_009706 [Neonectria punicea]|uniref:Zn(2)-C6 fungal-type domain-containing protein n=1 Tax=Neonectria punicea TaxID=979145 RepID=A0ABR1GRV1_9HYPO